MRIRTTLAAFGATVAIVASALTTLPAASAATGVTGSSYPSMLRKIGTVQRAVASPDASASATVESISPESELALTSRRLWTHHKSLSASSAGSTSLPTAGNLSVASATVRNWRGLTAFDNRYSDGGNQLSSEPSDMAMCTDGTYVVQMVNSAIQIYSTTGTAALAGTYGGLGAGYAGAKAYSLNQFFGYPSWYDRSTGDSGPDLYDITCLYDAAAARWFLVSAVLEVVPESGEYTGDNWVEIIVSDGANPVTSNWTAFRLYTTNDGRFGTPDHGCADDGAGNHQCFGDYPQIGLDQNALFVTTNEFDWWGNGDFHSAQLYAIDKADLLAGDPSPQVSFFESPTSAGLGDVTYTLQPANALPSQMVADTMYFGMSWSPYYPDGYSATAFSVFSVEGTDDLSTATLSETVVETTAGYTAPPAGQQKSGLTPTLEYYNSGAAAAYFGFPRFRKIASPIPLSTGSGKFYGAWLSNGYLFFTTSSGAAGTGGAVFGTQGTWSKVNQRSVVALFTVAVSPSVASSTTASRLVGVSGQNLGYPSVAVNAAGKGAVGVTLNGPSYNPSAAFLPFRITATGAIAFSSVLVARAGLGPNDGYTGWYPGYWRTRWGDYNTAAVDPLTGNIWMATGYTHQTCSYASWSANPTCNYTRNFYANWGSAVYRYVP
jgi:hypothetical protein